MDSTTPMAVILPLHYPTNVRRKVFKIILYLLIIIPLLWINIMYHLHYPTLPQIAYPRLHSTPLPAPTMTTMIVTQKMTTKPPIT